MRLDASNVCPFLNLNTVMAGLVPAIHVQPAKRTWMPGTRPGMTTAISRAVGTMLRSLPKCPTRSSLRPGWIVEKTLAENPVAAPLLPCELVDPMHLAGFVRQFKDPVNGNAVTFN